MNHPTSTNAASSPATLLPLPKNAADMFKAYTNGLEFGNNSTSSSNTMPSTTNHTVTTTPPPHPSATTTSSSTSSSSSSSSFAKPGMTKADIMEGAKRLAKELDDFIRNGIKSHHHHPNHNNNMTPFPRLDNAQLSDKAVADLQLATARKLREVCMMVVSKGKQMKGSIYIICCSILFGSGFTHYVSDLIS
jgi:hypothetical protein